MSHKTKPFPRERAPAVGVPDRWRVGFVCAALIAGNALLFGPVLDQGFSSLDDWMYLTGNPTVQAGLTWAGVKWAFTTLAVSYWQPLTYLSHMLGWELFGAWAGGHHAINLTLHMVSSVLTFLVLRRLTGALWRSAAVAALFAFHPLHVETVAWLADRQDALGNVFWMLALWAWAWYAARPSVARYAAVAGMFALSLMSKPMVVTLPAILLLLDYWPLARRGWKRLVVEKVPLALMSVPVVTAAYVAEKTTGATGLVGHLTVWNRISNAIVSYAVYAVKTVWPSSLAVLYPYERDIPVWQVAGATLLVGLAVWAAARTRYALVGCAWFVIGLLPAIGLVQVGFQSRADRYTYIPLTGLFIAIVWSLGELRPVGRWAALALLPLWVASAAQVSYWSGDLTLFRHAVAVTRDNALAQNNLGQALTQIRKHGEAIPHFREAVRLNPRCAECYNNLGVALFETSQYQEALAQFDRALGVAPDYANASYNRAEALVKLNRKPEALAAFESSLKFGLGERRGAAAHNAAGMILADTGRPEKALAHFQQAVSLDPGDDESRKNLAVVLYVLGKEPEADAQLSGLNDQRRWEAHISAARLLAAGGRLEDAVPQFESAVRLDPNNTGTRKSLAAALAKLGKRREAEAQWKAVLEIDPADSGARREIESLGKHEARH